MFYQVERYEWLQVLANIIAFILDIFRPLVTPIGEWMVSWIDFSMNYFPADALLIYIIIFVALVVCGIIINCKWPGEKYISVVDTNKEEDE
ncbi:MAG: hypothetical protein ACFFAH_03785 [Promethearchaeota archaeon]